MFNCRLADLKQEIISIIEESIDVKKKLIGIAGHIELAAKIIIDALKRGGKVITFGNGGSAADAQHIAAELVGRFQKNRKAFPAVALTTNTSILTSISNDYSFDLIFSRQLEALLDKNDVCIAISTSGNSSNVVEGIKTAKAAGAKVISLTGEDGGAMAPLSDISINVPSKITARIQESHIAIGHILCQMVEKELS